MSALDQYHNAVRTALVKEGWTITDDPLTLIISGARLHIDLGAERVLAAERGTEKIAVEVKTFGGVSKIADLENAAGQYIVYRTALRRRQPERVLYLAVPETILAGFFQDRELWQALVEDEKIHLIGYDPIQQELTKWLLIP
jgi:hypothetical protein